MIYRFTLMSDEVDQFRREVQIDPDATFYDLFKAIYKSVKYDEGENASFFICDEDWEAEKEVALQENDDNFEEDTWIMEDTELSELLEDEQQRLTLQFDVPNERYFFIELAEIITGKTIGNPKITKNEGDAPTQHFVEEVVESKKTKALDVDETFYGDQDYDSLELEGFENLEEL